MADRMERTENDKRNPGEKSTSGPAKTSHHGCDYQLELFLLTALHSSSLMQIDPNFTCSISSEDPEEGKFDDTAFRYRFFDSEHVLCIQAKHKADQQQKVRWTDLVDDSMNGPYAIVKYFHSFLATRERDATAEQVLYALCTNADLDEDVKDALQVQNIEMAKESDPCYIFQYTSSSCYSFNIEDRVRNDRMQKIFDVLKNSSECNALGKMLAESVYNGKNGKKKPLFLLTSNPQRYPLLVKHKKAIISHVLGEKRIGKQPVYDLKPEFCSSTSNLWNAFEGACRKLAGNVDDLKVDIVAKGITLKQALQKSDCMDVTNSILPDDWVRDEDIIFFFEKFRLFTGLGNEKDMSESVMELWKQLNASSTDDTNDSDTTAAYYEMYVNSLKWLVHNPMIKMSEENINTFLEKIRFNTMYRKDVQYFNETCVKKLGLDKYSISIKQKCLDQSSVYKFLCPEDESSILTYKSHYNLKYDLLLAKEIIQTFQARLSEQERYETLFIDNEMFQERKKTIKAILRLKTIRSIVVIACTDGSKEVLYNKFKKYERLNGRIKIILIEESDGRSNSDALVGHLLVSDLTKNSKEQLFPENKTLCIFGTEIHLSQMVEEKDDLTNALELLECLGQLDGKPSLVEQMYNGIRDWYIQRRLCLYRSMTRETKSDRIMSFSSLYLALSAEFKRNDEFYLEHLTKITNDHLIGAVNDPPELGDESHASEKVCIVLDEAGFGKSTYLTWLGWYLLRKDASQWILRFNAIDYSTDFEQILEKSTSDGQEQHEVDESEALRVLFQLVYLALFVRDINRQSVEDMNRERAKAGKCANLMILQGGQIDLDETASEWVQLTVLQRIVMRLFRAAFNSKKLVILFDGFYEAVPHYKKTMCRLFFCWQTFEGIYKIYLTSRPYELKSEFEKLFQDRAKFFCMEPFNEDDRLLAVHLFMLKKFEQYQCCEKSLQCKLLEILKGMLELYLEELRDAPLFIQMGMNILLPLVQKHVNFVSGAISPNLQQDANMEKLRMIEMFIDNKLSIAIIKKTQTMDAACKTAVALDNTADLKRLARRMHSIVALYVFFNQEEIEKMLSTNYQMEAIEYMEKIRRGSVRSGLILGIVGEKPLFIHRVFAEYFAALYLYELYVDKLSKDKQTRGTHLEITWYGEHRGIMEFFDRMLIRDSGNQPIHLAAIDSSFCDIETLLKNNPKMHCGIDAGGRTFLHLFVLHVSKLINNLVFYEWSVVDFMFKQLDKTFIDLHDRLWGYRALDYAILLHSFKLLPYFIRSCASINVDTILRFIKKEVRRIKDILDYATYFERELNKFPFSSGSRKYMSDAPDQIVEHLVHEKHAQKGEILLYDEKRTALEHCVVQDAVGMFRSLVKLAGGLQKVPVEKLLLRAFSCKAVHIIQYLIVESKCKFPMDLEEEALLYILKRSIECHYKALFNMLRKGFFKWKGISVKELLNCNDKESNNSIDVEEPDENYEIRDFEFQNDRISSPIDSDIFGLLCTSVNSGNRYALECLLTISGIPVVNALIADILTAVPEELHQIGCWTVRSLVYLIDKSQDLNIPDDDGKSLLQVAIEKGWTSVAKHLIEKKEFDDENALSALANADWQFNTMKFLIEKELRPIEGCEKRTAFLCELLKNVEEYKRLHFLEWIIEQKKQEGNPTVPLLWKSVYEIM